MRMLTALKDQLDYIKKNNEWEYNFITSIMEQKEKNPNLTLSSRQFEIVNRMHDKYCN